MRRDTGGCDAVQFGAMQCVAMGGDGSIKSSKVGDKLKVGILESKPGQRNKTKAAVPINKTAGQKREKGRAELCGTALFGHESYRINHQRVLLMSWQSPQEEQESAQELKGRRW